MFTDDQANSLREKISQQEKTSNLTKKTNTYSLSITSGKGGVGKTNLVINLAIQLANLGKKVLLIDADLGLANIDIMLNLTTKHTFEEVLKGTVDINETIIQGPNGVDILPASSGISEVADLENNQQLAMLDSLSNLNTSYEYILIDTGAGISSNVLRFNAAVDEVFVVTTPEPTAMTDAYALMKVMLTKYQVHKFSLIVNQASQNVAQTVYERLDRVFKQFLPVDLILRSAVPRDPNFTQAVRRQVPLSLLKPDSQTIQFIRRLAMNIDNQDTSFHKEDVSMWHKLASWMNKNS